MVTANVSATSIEAGTSASVSGAFTYRFTKAVGLGIEVVWVPSLTPDTSNFPGVPSTSTNATIFPPIPIIPTISLSGDGGRTVVVSTNVRFEIPTDSRFAPYVIAGGGFGTIKEDYTLKLSLPDVLIQAITELSALGFPIPANLTGPYSQPISRTLTSVALTAGGGVSINLNRRWAADVELRYVSLIGSQTTHIGRYGGGVSYKF